MQTVWIAGNIRRTIEQDSIRWGVRETGGPLFGYERHGELVITRAGLPGPRAVHLPFLYRPDRTAVQREIDEVFALTGGRERWIGSWHSHPLGRPLPSLVDRRTAARVGAEQAVMCPKPVMLIQTTRMSTDGVGPGPLGLFRWSREQAALMPLRPAA
jgi:integrative and conjugative element protein (TIGR02256 family)